MLSRSQKIKFSILQITYWCSIASFASFSIAYVRTKGISATYIGIMGAVFMLCAVAGQLFWGGVCDRFQKNKIVFIITNACLLTVSMAFYFTVSPGWILITYAAMGFLQSPTASNLDSWILKNAKNNFSQYGPIRSMGSLGFSVFIFFYGTLISSKGYGLMPVFLSFFILSSIIVSLTIPEIETGENIVTVVKITPADIKALFYRKSYLYLIIILFFAGLSLTSVAQNKILIWEDLKAPISYQGFDSSFHAVFQVPFLFLTLTLSRINVKVRLAGAMLFNFIMLLVLYFAKIPQVVVVGSIISGTGFGLLLPSMREIIAASTPERLRTTAQGLGDAVYASLSGISGSLLAGVIIDSFGVKSMLLICVGVFLIPLTLTLFALIPKKRGSHPV